MITIKSHNDAKEFVNNFKKYSNDIWGENSYNSFTFKDQGICHPNGGSTTIIYNEKDNTYYQYSSGPDWCDQEKEQIEDIIKFVWDCRKSINLALKNKNNNY